MTGRGRRWSDWVDTDGADVSRLDRARAVALAAWPFLACAAVVAVILAATIVSVRAIRERDELAAVAANAAAASVDAKRAADSAEAEAVHIAALLQAAEDRDANREAVIDEAIGRIDAANAEAHSALLGQIAKLLNRPVPTSTPRAVMPTPRPTPTVASRPPPPAPEATAVPSTTAAPPPTEPATTTTTCEQRGKSGRCKR